MLTIKAESNNVHARDTPLREIPQTKIFVRDRLRDKRYAGRSQHTHTHTCPYSHTRVYQNRI